MRRARIGAVVLALVLAPSLVSCGGSEAPPSEQVPALGKQLDQVDAAVEDGDFAQAREVVKQLVATTAQAQLEGDLSDEQAQRIVAAARSVLENLPAED